MGRKLHKEVVDGVYSHTIKPDFVVEVGRERKATIARQTNDVATLYFIALFDIDAREMTILCFVTSSVVDYDVASRGCLARLHLFNFAVGGGENARAYWDGLVYSLMRHKTLVEGVNEHTIGSRKER